MTKARNAINPLQPEKWEQTAISTRIKLLKAIRNNLKRYGGELAVADTQMKNNLMNESLFSHSMSKAGTLVPLGNTVTACIDLYQSLQKIAC